jgi:hypothetical protein
MDPQQRAQPSPPKRRVLRMHRPRPFPAASREYRCKLKSVFVCPEVPSFVRKAYFGSNWLMNAEVPISLLCAACLHACRQSRGRDRVRRGACGRSSNHSLPLVSRPLPPKRYLDADPSYTALRPGLSWGHRVIAQPLKPAGQAGVSNVSLGSPPHLNFPRVLPWRLSDDGPGARGCRLAWGRHPKPFTKAALRNALTSRPLSPR